jgi:nucleoside-diphosphate-sugar epimerase
MQTILGAGGVIAHSLQQQLLSQNIPLRLVRRQAGSAPAGAESRSADLLNAQAVAEAVAGSEVVYLTPGLTYNARLWAAQWPVVMQNTIAACEKAGAKLVFFDNVYAYGLVDGPMTEATPYNPCSKKGEVRAQIARLLHDRMGRSLDAMIVRAADFYGPHNKTSFAHIMVFERLAAGKGAQLLVADQVPHVFSYTPNAGAATALLGNTPSAYNQVWHLPAPENAITGKELVEIAAAALGVKPKYQVVGKGMLKMLGWFIPVLRENQEMLYQFERPYLFNSEKFKAAFPEFAVTSYAEGAATVAKSLQQKA